MIHLISGAISSVQSLLKQLQVTRFLSVVLVGFLLLTTNVDPGRDSRAISKQVNEAAHQTDSQRPKTTGEWNREARETKGAPGERLQRIAGESAEAVKDWGALYPDTAERSARTLQDGTSSTGRSSLNNRS